MDTDLLTSSIASPIDSRKRRKSVGSSQKTPGQRGQLNSPIIMEIIVRFHSADSSCILLLDLIDPSRTRRVATTSADSPNVIPGTFSGKNPFLDDVDEDDFIVPDSTESPSRFSAMLDGQDVGGSFGQLFQDVRAKKVFVTDTDQALYVYRTIPSHACFQKDTVYLLTDLYLLLER